MKKFLTTLTILVFTFFLQGCNDGVQIQGSSHIYINEAQPYKVLSITDEAENADSYQWKVKSKNKDYILSNDQTSAVIFNAQSIGTYTLEVKVKKDHKTFKTELEIEVTEPEVINGYTLPSEPNPTINNSTLLGIDINDNGVRDDVERYVIKRYAKDPEFPKTKTALAMQYAWAEQKIIENPVIESKQYTDDTMYCESYWLNKNTKGMSFSEYLKYSQKHEVFNDKQIRAKIYNTRKRIEQSFEFNRACSGQIFTLSEYTINNCQINIDELGE
ncbi:MAG: hypothetical protein ABXS93_00940 [Sulfurimonas sp.]